MLEPAQTRRSTPAPPPNAPGTTRPRRSPSVYRALDEPLLQERAADVLDVGRRVVGALTGESATATHTAGIVIAGELTPGDAATLDPALVHWDRDRARHRHRARRDPRARARPSGRGRSGRRDPADRRRHDRADRRGGRHAPGRSPRTAQRDATERRERADRTTSVGARTRARDRAPPATAPGSRCSRTWAPPARRPRAVELGAEGVGLLRTEFLFLDRAELPTRTSRRRRCARSRSRSTAVRWSCARSTPAPTSRCRRCRCRPRRTRSSAFAGFGSGSSALTCSPPSSARSCGSLPNTRSRRCCRWSRRSARSRPPRAALEQARADTGIDAPLEFGIMVEVPAAALTATRLAEHVDFFSLGTNDLTQYTMAAERGDERLAPLLTGPQPAVLRLVKETVQAAAAHGRWVGVCGELAGDPASRAPVRRPRRDRAEHGAGARPGGQGGAPGGRSRAGSRRRRGSARDRQRGSAPARCGRTFAVR